MNRNEISGALYDRNKVCADASPQEERCWREEMWVERGGHVRCRSAIIYGVIVPPPPDMCSVDTIDVRVEVGKEE